MRRFISRCEPVDVQKKEKKCKKLKKSTGSETNKFDATRRPDLSDWRPLMLKYKDGQKSSHVLVQTIVKCPTRAESVRSNRCVRAARDCLFLSLSSACLRREGDAFEGDAFQRRRLQRRRLRNVDVAVTLLRLLSSFVRYRSATSKWFNTLHQQFPPWSLREDGE